MHQNIAAINQPEGHRKRVYDRINIAVLIKRDVHLFYLYATSIFSFLGTVIVGLLIILTALLPNQSSIYVYNDVICPLLKCLLTWIEDATLYTKARPLAQVKQRQKQAKWMQIIRSAAKASQGRNLQE